MRVSCSTVSRPAASPPRASAAASGPSSPPVRQISPGGVLAEVVEVRRALALCCFAHLELRNELAEILIALPRCAKQRQARRLAGMLMRQPGRRRQPRPEAGDGNLRADVRANATALRAGVKTGRAVDAVMVEQRHCRHLQRRCPLDQALRLRCSLKKAEGARRVQLDISLSHRAPPSATDRAAGHGSGSSRASRHPGRVPPDPIARIPKARHSTTRRLSARDRRPVPLHSAARERRMPRAARSAIVT